jgi:rubrerythrin
MTFNPLTEKGIPLEKQLRSWRELNVEPFNKKDVHPYTQCRVIVMNGTEMEAMWFSHQFARHTPDIGLKRGLALTRRIEQQQQKACNWLLPGSASPLEVTIGYEQVAIDLTAWLARNEPDPYAKQCYDFGLLEDFDHLYRYANLMDMLEGKKAQDIVDGCTEIMPGRPTALEHRDPHDEIRKPLKLRESDPLSALHALTIVAAEQQTLNFYNNVGNIPTDPLARALYLEIAQIEEQHVTHYESMVDAGASWAEMLVLHEYNECYLYHSFMQQEPDPRIRAIWELHLNMEIEHLRLAADLMRKLDGREPAEILPKAMPMPVTFEENKAYVRKVLEGQVQLTGDGTGFVPVDSLPADHRYHRYQATVNAGGVPSEEVIKRHIETAGGEYRHELEGRHPVYPPAA